VTGAALRQSARELFPDMYERQRARKFDLLPTGEFVMVRSDAPPGALNVMIEPGPAAEAALMYDDETS
jgi:hypothetical protein